MSNSPSADDIRFKIESSRKELLDQTFRNPLLNYRSLKARGVEVVEAHPEAVYQILVTSRRKLTFAPVSSRSETENALGAGESTHFDNTETATQDANARAAFDAYFDSLDGDTAIPESPSNAQKDAPTISEELAALVVAAESERQSIGDSEVAEAKLRRGNVPTRLQTACSPVELQHRLLGTMHTAHTFVEEQGVNTLFLALGMLTWREANTLSQSKSGEETPDSGATHRSPLLLIPVALERASASDHFTLRYTEEDIASNVSLDTYLQQNFGITLPSLPEREDIDAAQYLEQVALLVDGRNGWEVDHNSVVLAFFSFNKYLMYKDLEDAAWPQGQGPSSHPVLNALLGDGFHEVASRFGEDDHLDRLLSPVDTKTVVEADSSQVLAIEDVKQGRNLVIQGPPGTGKSQSITNIIAEALGQNKTVLFVSEKMAALEVVKRRLDSVGLGDACLELHSNKTNKKVLLTELKRTLSLGRPVESQNADDDLSLLAASRDRLNAYCDAVNAPVGVSGWTANGLYGEWLRLHAEYEGIELPRAELPPSHSNWTSLDYRQREQVVAELQAQITTMGGAVVQHPFWGAMKTTYISTDAEEFQQAFMQAYNSTVDLHAVAEKLAAKLTLPTPCLLKEVQALTAAVQQAIEAPEHDGMQFSSGQWLARRGDLSELIRQGSHMSGLKVRNEKTLIPEAWDTDVREAQQAITAHGNKWHKFLIGDWHKAQKAMRLLCHSVAPREAAEQIELLNDVQDYRRTKASFTEQSALGATLFGAQWQGERSNWPVLSQLLDWIISIHEEVGDGKLPKAFIDFLSGASDLKVLAPDVTAARTATAAYQAQVHKALNLLEWSDETCFGAGGTFWNQPFLLQSARIGRWVSEVERLHQVTAFNHLLTRCHALELDGITRTAEKAENDAALLVPAFQRAYCQSLLRQVFTANPDLANFSGSVHSQTAAQFRALDTRFLEHNRARLASQHWQSVAKLNGLIGQGGNAGQLRVLTREFEKRSRHLPIRRLLAEAGNAVLAVKPVFMMSPLSVATFLTPGFLKFDLIVFDEASQVKPVDALGALARGTQAVVVGDSKQLPPTSFFDSLAQSDGLVDDDNETADMESVLGLFAGQGAPQRMLKWHYRSRHESLIAVSNQEFYDNKLIIFPSPDAARERFGLSYRHLPATTYDRGGSGTNTDEAKAIAEAVLAHARLQQKKPQKEWQTLGVAAFSMGQMQAIRDQLETLRRLNPDTEAFINASVKNEPFFVKNLENVQGDERDVIFISVGYGRDKNGQVSINFGPLNKQGGERRLNVLISRARLRCEVFTNLLPNDIDLSRTSARGVEAFKKFLTYARGAGNTLPTDTAHSANGANGANGANSATAFEHEVLRVLRAEGYEAMPQVGCAGYFIDLAVVDPKHPGRYVLGIECDGPNYQSARSARDRDRLRAEVLSAMGWQLHRVWSTDWVHRYADEVEKLKAVVAAATESSHSVEASPASETIPDGDSFYTEQSSGSGLPDNTLSDEPAFQRLDDVAEHSTVAAVAQAYTVASLPPAYHLNLNDSAHFEAIAQLVSAVVAVESPVHCHEASRRIALALGVQRLTGSFNAKMAVTTAIAERSGYVRKQGDFLWTPEMMVPLLRNRAVLDARSRSIDFVCAEEIGLAVKQSVKEAYGIAFDEVARAACRILGFERVTSETKERVDNVVRDMIKANAFTLTNGIVTPL